MGIIIGSLADLIFYWVIINPSNSKEVAIFVSLAVISISLDMVSATLRKLTVNDIASLLLAQWKPIENIVSCVVGIALWKLIEPLSLVSVIVFIVTWLVATLLIVLAVINGMIDN